MATLRHPDTGGTQRVPDSPDVIAHFEARGWVVTEDAPDPDDVRNISLPADNTAPGEEWVEMTHPDLPHAPPHLVPNHPEAIAGMAESGWVLPKQVEDAGKASESASVKRRQKTTAEAGKDNDAAGDGTDEKE